MTKTALFVKAKRFLIVFAISLVFFGALLMVTSSLVGITLGGSKKAVFRVQTDSSSCWSGFFGDASRQACGSSEYAVTSTMGIFAGSVQKQSADGMPLTLQLIIDGKIVYEYKTTADYGLATASGSG